MDKHTAYFNLLDALPEPGCVICRLGHHVEVKYIRDVLYGQTTSVETRAKLRGARGFCLFHARQLDEIGHALDVSIIYQDIILTLKEILDRPSPQQIASRRGKKRLADTLASTRECPACVYRAELEQVYVETLLDHLVDPDFVAQVRAADPFCLAHLRQLVLNTYQAEQFEILRDIQTAHWEKLIWELGEFVRKHDHRFHDEKVGREGTAWMRAVDAIAGTRKY